MNLDETKEKSIKNNEKEDSLEVMDTSIRQEILRRAGATAQFYNECYQLLPKDKFDLLLNLRPEAQKVVIQYIRGEIPCDNLPDDEQSLIRQLQNDYNLYLQKQQGASSDDVSSISFQIELDQLRRIIYNNFFHRVSFGVLEVKENNKDREAAEQIAEERGFHKKNISN